LTPNLNLLTIKINDLFEDLMKQRTANQNFSRASFLEIMQLLKEAQLPLKGGQLLKGTQLLNVAQLLNEAQLLDVKSNEVT
jgi:hypothetical protein